MLMIFLNHLQWYCYKWVILQTHSKRQLENYVIFHSYSLFLAVFLPKSKSEVLHRPQSYELCIRKSYSATLMNLAYGTRWFYGPNCYFLWQQSNNWCHERYLNLLKWCRLDSRFILSSWNDLLDASHVE